MLSELRQKKAALQPNFIPPLKYTIYFGAFCLCIIAVCTGCTTFLVLYINWEASKTRDIVMIAVEVSMIFALFTSEVLESKNGVLNDEFDTEHYRL